MTIHPDDTYDGGRLCLDVTTKHGGHHSECCCYQCDPPTEDLYACCANCGTELRSAEIGWLCPDCKGATR
jgi:hypothetical protein